MSPWVGMPSVSRVTDRLYVGCFGDGRLSVLAEHGIQAVCNCTDDDYFSPAAEYLCLEQLDGDWVPERKIRAFLEWMEVQRAANRRVLVHCHAGISRAPSFTILWMLWCDQVPRAEYRELFPAWSEREDLVRMARPIIEPHGKLKHSLLEFYERYGPV